MKCGEHQELFFWEFVYITNCGFDTIMHELIEAVCCIVVDRSRHLAALEKKKRKEKSKGMGRSKGFLSLSSLSLFLSLFLSRPNKR